MKSNLFQIIPNGSYSAILACLLMGLPGLAQAADCDVDGDGDIDRIDVKKIVISRDTLASGPDDSRDADGNGKIDMADTRICIRRCSLPNCKIIGDNDPATISDQSRSKSQNEAPIQGSSVNTQTPKPVVSGKEWRVKKGDTLYAIGRAFFPGDARRQAQLRQDIVNLNPSVFAGGVNNMSVGVVLKLPAYVISGGSTSKVIEPAPDTGSVTVGITPEPEKRNSVPASGAEPGAQKPSSASSVSESEVTSEPVKKAKEGDLEDNGKPDSSRSSAEGGFLASLGFSYGGDEVVKVDSGLDFLAGSGAHLRLGYEQLPNRRSGYRIALGTQYNFTLSGGSDDASLTDTYLQLAYQYRADDLLYGIGVIAQSGPTVKNDVAGTTEFDPANGVVFYLENVGNTKWSGFGISYTSIELDEKNTNETADASRAEAYYSWRF